MIHFDMNFLIRGLTPGTPEQRAWDQWVEDRIPVRVSAQAWAEFMCGPVSQVDVTTARLTLGTPIPVNGADAELATELFNAAGRRRGSLGDCLVAAKAIRDNAELATANTADFARFAPRGLRLAAP